MNKANDDDDGDGGGGHEADDGDEKKIIYEYIRFPHSDNEAIKLTTRMTLPHAHMANCYAIASN